MNPSALLGGLLLAVAAYFVGHYTGDTAGETRERATWQTKEIKQKEAYTTALRAEIAKRTSDQLAHQASARKASTVYETALAAKDETYAAKVADLQRRGGMRIPAPACPRTLAATAEATGSGKSHEVAPATVALPEQTQQQLLALTSEADQISEQLRALQGWVRDNGFYGQTE